MYHSVEHQFSDKANLPARVQTRSPNAQIQVKSEHFQGARSMASGNQNTYLLSGVFQLSPSLRVSKEIKPVNSKGNQT